MTKKHSTAKTVPAKSKRITEIRALIGHDVVLIPNHPGTKRPTQNKWSSLTHSAMMDPKHIRALERGNIGVLLGKASGHLCAVDIDLDELVAPFIAANPFLKRTLQTHGARGCVFWLRMDGSYPDKIVKLKARSGQDCGEFRSNGCQSVISGIHPDGHSYKITKKSPPVKIRYSEIKWPVEITPPLQPFTSLGSHSFPSVVIRSHLLHANESEECERLVQESIPSGKGQNHRNLFDLARRLKGMEQRTGTAMTVDQQKAVFSIWHKQAAEFLRPGQSFDEYFFEFLDAWERVRYPAGEAVLTGAWERAQKTSPPEASLVDDPDIRRLVSLCWELQLRAGNRPFILPCRVVQRLFHHENHVRGWRWLQGLCRLKVLDMVKAGNSAKRECSKYRYLFTPQSTTNRKEI